MERKLGKVKESYQTAMQVGPQVYAKEKEGGEQASLDSVAQPLGGISEVGTIL